jgi:hypothetical protein
MANTSREIAQRLRKIAQEIVETALGSSRIEMYTSLATELREAATQIEQLTEPPEK